MREREDIEAWADAMLDAHRTGPPRPQPAPEDTARTIEDLPPTLRFLIERGIADPDPTTLERIARRRRRFENAEAIGTVVAILAFCAVAFALSAGF